MPRGTPVIPEQTNHPGDHDTQAALGAVEEVAAASQLWAATPPAELARIVEATRASTATVAAEWVEQACRAKGITVGTPPASEEWQSGPWALLRNLRYLQASLEDLAAGRRPRIPGDVRNLPDGRVAVPAFPFDVWDRLLFPGVTAEVRMQPGTDAATLRRLQASAFSGPAPPRVGLVLGAGNISSIAPMDAVYKLFVERSAVVLKLNPVTEYLGPVLTAALRPIIETGALRIVNGGAGTGTKLVAHAAVSHVHVTGSDKTYERMVFGGGDAGTAAKAARTPVLDKPVTAELGNVTPVIIMPGPWSERDLDHQAENLAVTLMHNAGFNCIATRVFIQHAEWDLRHTLLERIESVMERTPVRDPYYPGAADRHARFVDAHPDARLFGDTSGVPWTVIRDVAVDTPDEICFETEAFSAVTAEVGLSAADPAGFLAAAVRFCNDRLWGSLGVSIFVHPRTEADPSVRAALERAVTDLRYGTVAINAWSGFGYAISSTPWGAYPGHTPGDIQSGVGVVHNTLMLENSEKSVVRAPWRAFPKPTWFPSHRSAHEVLEATTYFERSPSAWGLARILGKALRA